MPSNYASARPHKRFFLEMFTRDISLQDCILDLIDNSIDGLVRSRQLNLSDYVLSSGATGQIGPPARIDVEFSQRQMRITDNCGGIDRRLAEREVFNFGHAEDGEGEPRGGLGAYGIGLKRALFKIGNRFVVESQTVDTGFQASIEDLAEWARHDSKLEDWRFPLAPLPAAQSSAAAGTKITISALHPDIRELLTSTSFARTLTLAIAQTYSLFLESYVRITVNGDQVAPSPIPIGSADDYQPSSAKWDDDGVDVRIVAGLAARGTTGEWRAESAGWYVLCNGRVIVSADKSELTGWGAGILPQFHSSKARGFVGLALFSSNDPLKLPWTTTKRSLNRESPVYLKARNRMASVAKPVYQFLDGLYASSSDDSPDEREVTKTVGQADVRSTMQRAGSNFSVTVKKRKRKTTTRIQYDAENADLDLIRSHLRSSTMAASQIGLTTFIYFLKQEGLR